MSAAIDPHQQRQQQEQAVDGGDVRNPRLRPARQADRGRAAIRCTNIAGRHRRRSAGLTNRNSSLAIADPQRADRLLALQSGAAQFGHGNGFRRPTADDADSQDQAVAGRSDSKLDVARRNQGHVVRDRDLANCAQRFAVGRVELEMLGNGRRHRERPLGPLAGAVGTIGKRAIGRDSQRQRIARDQAFDAPRSRLRADPPQVRWRPCWPGECRSGRARPGRGRSAAALR